MKLWDECSQTVIFITSFVFFSHSFCLIHTLRSSRHRKQRGCDPGSFSCHTDRRKLNRSLKESIQRDSHESSRLTLNYLLWIWPVLTLQLFNSTSPCFLVSFSSVGFEEFYHSENYLNGIGCVPTKVFPYGSILFQLFSKGAPNASSLMRH